ncbi:MAG: transposase [Myxococcales bacterium]|nr:transposase [Myxococcales bacterium]
MHCRRYFHKAFEAGDPRAAVALGHIKKPYKVEEDSRNAEDSSGERLARWLVDSSPILDDIEAWIAKHKPTEPPKTLLGKALSYADRHRDLLRAIEVDGALEIDNGDVERILRGPAMGPKKLPLCWIRRRRRAHRHYSHGARNRRTAGCRPSRLAARHPLANLRWHQTRTPR